MEPTAVCVLIRRGQKFLAVARRGTTDEWGLPGGKIDACETPREAAVRELLEETGLTVLESSLQEVFTSVCGPGPDGKKFLVVTFATNAYEGVVKQGDAGPVDWVSETELISGPFGDYNKELLAKAAWKYM